MPLNVAASLTDWRDKDDSSAYVLRCLVPQQYELNLVTSIWSIMHMYYSKFFYGIFCEDLNLESSNLVHYFKQL